ncbi:MAG: tRNA lysidine(34) synthetase TilS [Firmicutes bacterium]|nr:tRNA lysidine(34) synthetase TilS [Bacillota bacterium]
MDKNGIIQMVEQKIRQAINDFGMSPRMKGILVGYSGGADSSALLYFLSKYEKEQKDVKIAAFHVNHMLRGDAADKDEEFCRAMCKKLGVEFFSERVDVGEVARREGKGLEEAGRMVRYSLFRKKLEEREDLSYVALAHHAEDNMETVIFNMLRGAGTHGFAGIPPVRGEFIIRPLIYCTKSEIIGYCIANDIPYVTDATNASNDYTRNYIRNELIPRFAKINPQPEMAVSRLCTSLRSDDAYIHSRAAAFVAENGINYRCERALLAEQPNAMLSRILCRMYKNCAAALGVSDIRVHNALDYTHITAVSRLIRGGSMHTRISLPHKICAAVDGDSFFFMSEDEYRQKYGYFPDYKVRLDFGEYDVPEIGAKILLSHLPDEEFELKYKNIYRIFIHKRFLPDKISGKLYIKNREAGDKIYLRGMSRLTKKLYCENKIPIDLRALIPVFCDDDGILWIPNIGVRDGAEASERGSIHIYCACCARPDEEDL